MGNSPMLTPPQSDVAGVVADLTEAQREALEENWLLPEGWMIWELAGIGLANCVGLTPLGLAARQMILAASQRTTGDPKP
jgi:hypothetical protein